MLMFGARTPAVVIGPKPNLSMLRVLIGEDHDPLAIGWMFGVLSPSGPWLTAFHHRFDALSSEALRYNVRLTRTDGGEPPSW